MFGVLKMIIVLITVCRYSKDISAEFMTNIIEDLSLRIPQRKNRETHPLQEGFILLPDDNKKSVNISTTPCTTVMKVTIKRISSSPSPILDHSIGHLGRRLLNEPSDDTEQMSEDKNWQMDDLMRIDMNEELNKQLFSFQKTMDGSGETTEETTVQTSTTTSLPITTTTTSLPITTTTRPSNSTQLSSESHFILTIKCPNANETFNEILTELRDDFGPYNILDRGEAQCNGSKPINVTLGVSMNSINTLRNFPQSDNRELVRALSDLQTQNNFFANLSSIAQNKSVDVYSVNKCDNHGIKPVINVTSCFLIELCYLCGTNPVRGVCVPEYKESRCECLPNKNDSSRPFTGEICLESESPLSPSSIPSRWAPVIIGIVAGVTGLLLMITVCLWAIFIWRGRRSGKFDLQMHRLWHLPRAKVPPPVTSDNFQMFPSRTTSPSRNDSDNDRSTDSDSSFFKDLDQRMGENLRSTITRPNSSALLASLPSDVNSNSTNYDPIDELDSIIDSEDISMIFHDPMTDEKQLFEATNPRFK